jgi:hypothetical protein
MFFLSKEQVIDCRQQIFDAEGLSKIAVSPGILDELSINVSAQSRQHQYSNPLLN